MTSSDLGAFLKERRAGVTPDDAGLPTHGVRRVPGLRREEVALLAGVSVDYYSRIEQGRERNPSPAVLNAVAGALKLDLDAREHVFRLAGLAPTPPVRADRVDPSLVALLASWPATPAFVINRAMDVRAHNDLAGALFSDFQRFDNLVLMTFVDPAGPGFFVDWGRACDTTVTNLRLALGHPGADGRAREIVAQVHPRSAEFSRRWSRYDVRGKTSETKEFQHSDVGGLRLDFNAFDVRSSPGDQLVVYRAADGTPSAEKLQLLGSLAASRKGASPQRRPAGPRG